MKEVIKLIIKKSKKCTGLGLTAIRSLETRAKSLPSIYTKLVRVALEDESAEFTDDQRDRILSFLDTQSLTKNHIIQIRLTTEEKKGIILSAKKEGLTMSDYVRSLLESGGPSLAS